MPRIGARRAVGLSLRLRILAAFCVLSVITLGLGSLAARSVGEAGETVAAIFDRALLATSYARSAAASFEAMDAAFARAHLAADAAMREAQAGRIAELADLLTGDLDIVAERSTSEAMSRAVLAARAAAQSWSEAARAGDSAGAPDWNHLAALAAAAHERFDVLVNQVAGDAFRQRQQARAAVAAARRRTIVGTVAALLLGVAVATLLTRQIIGPLGAASWAASGIAAGRLDTPIPAGGRDELGTLLTAMGRMRDAIRATIEGEQAERRSAQGRLADALEGSTEGVVLTDAGGRITAANARAAELLPRAAELLRPGEDWARAVATALDGAEAMPTEALHGAPPAVAELMLDGGAWLRVSRSPARDGGSVAVLSDVTDLKAHEAALAESNRRFGAALGNMSHGLCMVDADGRVLVCNRRFAELFGLPSAAGLAGLPVGEVFRAVAEAGRFPADLVASIERDQHALAHEPRSRAVLREGPGGEALAVSHQPMAGGGWVATYEDVTERRRAEARVAFMAHHDALTGLPNRVLLRERIEQAIARLGRGTGFAVLCLDLDRFKPVNDTLGHPIGDLLLRQVAERLLACARETDTVARLGGDEFAVVQAGAEQPEDAAELARRILAAIGEPFDLDGQQVVVGASIGIAMAPADGVLGDRLLRSADIALYRSKLDGRGVHRFFEPDMDARQQARRAMEVDLRRALTGEELDVFYQPLVDLASDGVCGFEALLRWRHPERGMVSPAHFIPVAEELNLIVPMGEWVLRRACRDASLWPPSVRVAVNVSPAQFKRAGLVDAVMGALAEAGLPAHRLELEITESVLLQDNAATLATLHRLRDLGVRISMDDFGTGYSSLSYLRSFPFDKIKIDQSFVRDLSGAGDAQAIVRAITGLGGSLGMRTTAEGVETEEQLARLRADGCNEVQGYFFSPPRPAAEVPALLERIGPAARSAAPARVAAPRSERHGLQAWRDAGAAAAGLPLTLPAST